MYPKVRTASVAPKHIDFTGWVTRPALLEEMAETAIYVTVVRDETNDCDTCMDPAIYRLAAQEALGDAGHDVFHCQDCMTGLFEHRTMLGDRWYAPSV